jgi:Kef-type K+ transport system membrane component KefB
LLAGLEINLKELVEEKKTLGFFLVQSLALIFIVGYLFISLFDLSFQAGVILALGLMTPSAGFILHSLSNLNLKKEEERWVRIKALSFEISAILVMFLTLQGGSWSKLGFSVLMLLACIVLLPVIFLIFFKFIAPLAPKTEMSFLVIAALIAGVFTKQIGAYYLGGAFIAGVVANEFKHLINAKTVERLEPSLEVFVTFFVPFYFFSAGMKLDQSYFSLQALALGLVLLAVFIPLRIGSVYATVAVNLRNFWHDRSRLALPLMPTLVFGLVMASILNDKFSTDKTLVGGLIIYTIVATLIPTLFLRTKAEAATATEPAITRVEL